MATYQRTANMNTMTAGTAYNGSNYAGSAAYGERAALKPANKSGFTSTKVANIFFCFVIVAVIMFVPITLHSTLSSIQASNNKIQAENDYIQAEINSIESQLVEVTKVTKIEKTATQKYGMVYPSASNCITIDKDEKTGNKLASTIKKEAYN